MAKSDSKNNNKDSTPAQSLWANKWMLLRGIVIAVALGLIAFFHELVFEIIGFSLALCIIWAVILIIIIWKRNWQILRRRWNTFTGIFLLTIGVWEYSR